MTLTAPALTRWRQEIRPVLIPAMCLFGIMSVVIGICVTAATWYAYGGANPNITWLESWYQFDGVWYTSIAHGGYFYVPGEMSAVAFFPSYPLMIAAVTTLIGNVEWAAVIITFTSAVAFLTVFVAWVTHRFPRPIAMTSVTLILLYPYALFLYGSMYSDALFFICAISALILAEQKHYWLAGLVGIVATAGRPVGVAVTVGITAMALQHIVITRRKLDLTPDVTTKHPIRFLEMIRAIRYVTWRECGVLLSLAGLLGWMAYQWRTFGTPLAWLSTQGSPGWDQPSGPYTWFKIRFFNAMLSGHPSFLIVGVQALMCLLAILLIRRSLRLLGWGYAAYAVTVLAIPIIGTKDFNGTGRYVLACFPVFIAAAHYVVNKHPQWRRVIYPLFALGSITATSLFAQEILVS